MAGVKIYFHKYLLHPVRSLNRLVPAEPRQGVLLRMEWDDGRSGYADCHPWPELGDPEVASQLRSIQLKKPLALAKTSMELAEWDASARADGRSLIDSSKIPESHFLIQDIEDFASERFVEIQEKGYRFAKVKVGRDPTLERQCLEKALSYLREGFRFRFDFNQALDAQAFRYWWTNLSDELKRRTDFVEDPTPFVASEWQELSHWDHLTLALDRGSDTIAPNEVDVPVRVVKPALQGITPFHSMAETPKMRFVFTTYMGHPLGQGAAVARAIQFYERHPQLQEVCGLQTAQLYEADEFSESIQLKGPRMKWPEEAGFGFGQVLQKLRWELLTSYED